MLKADVDFGGLLIDGAVRDPRPDEELLALDLEKSVRELETWWDSHKHGELQSWDDEFHVAVSRVWNVAHTLKVIAKDNNGNE